VAVDDLTSYIGCLVPGFELGGVGGALGTHVFNCPAFIVPTLSRTLAWVMRGLWALVHHARNIPSFAAVGWVQLPHLFKRHSQWDLHNGLSISKGQQL
jgi:hypothetical protein